MPTDLPPAIQAFLDGVLPQPTFQAGFLILVSILLAWLVNRIMALIVSRWAKRTRSDIDDRLVGILRRPVFISVILVGFFLATQRLDLPDPLPFLMLASIKTVAIFVWLVFGFQFCSLVLAILSLVQDRFQIVQPRTVPLFDNLLKVFLVGGALYLTLLAWNIDVSGWLASAGIVGIAVGFAAKDTLANLFAGVFILADAPYKVGDYVNLDGGDRGQVTQIGIRSTRLLTRDDVEITVPNAVIGNAKIINETGGRWDKLRIRIPVGVAYGSDIDQVRSLLMEIAEAEEGIVHDPEPRVRFRQFGESSLDFQLMGWIPRPELRGRVLDALLSAIYKRFNEAGIEFPYPKRDLYLHGWTGPGATEEADEG